MSKRVIGALLTACPALAAASADDFARGTVIVPPAQKDSAYRVAVPADVYRWSTRDDLGDLRVLDGAGNEQPYMLRVPPGGSAALTDWRDLPAFALPATITATGAAAVNIELGKGGAVVAVHGANTAAEARSYLIDASAYHAPIDELHVTWSTPGDVFVTASIAASDDLNQWRDVLPSTTLAMLTTDGQAVKLDRIPVNGARAKYLKLGFDRDLAITGARARSREPTAAVRDRAIIDGTVRRDGIEFDTRGRFPVDRVAVELDAPTYLLDARVFSRPGDEGLWRGLGIRTFYRATAGETTATSDPMSVTSQSHRYWRVVTTKQQSTPRLAIEWLPHEVVFVAQGEPPFRLVYGQAGVVAREWPIADLLKRLGRAPDLDTLPTAATQQAEMLGGPARLVPPPAPIDWRTIWLWVVLVIGVGVVAGLALRLVRQGRNDPPPSDSDAT